MPRSRSRFFSLALALGAGLLAGAAPAAAGTILGPCDVCASTVGGSFSRLDGTTYQTIGEVAPGVAGAFEGSAGGGLVWPALDLPEAEVALTPNVQGTGPFLELSTSLMQTSFASTRSAYRNDVSLAYQLRLESSAVVPDGVAAPTHVPQNTPNVVALGTNRPSTNTARSGASSGKPSALA